MFYFSEITYHLQVNCYFDKLNNTRGSVSINLKHMGNITMEFFDEFDLQKSSK